MTRQADAFASAWADDKTLYIRQGRKYVPVRPFYGFPADGVWLVVSTPGCRSQRRITEVAPGVDIAKIADVPDPIPLASIERHRDAAAKGALDFLNKRCFELLHQGKTEMAATDLVASVFQAIAQSLNETTHQET